METQHLALAISAANFILTWGVALYMYLANKNKVTNERINTLQEDIDDKLDDHSERIARLEVGTEGAVSFGDLHGLRDKIASVDSKVSGISGRLDGIDATLRQMTGLIMGKGLK